MPLGDPTFEPVRYWRGPVWTNVNWLLGERERSLELVARSGFWEYYHPLTGEGLGASDFSRTAALTLDFLS